MICEAIMAGDEARINEAAEEGPLVLLGLASGRGTHGMVLEARSGLLIIENADGDEEAIVLADVMDCDEVDA